MSVSADGRRERLRAMLADPQMPGALVAVDGVMARLDSGAVTAGEPLERLLGPRLHYATTYRPTTAPMASASAC